MESLEDWMREKVMSWNMSGWGSNGALKVWDSGIFAWEIPWTEEPAELQVHGVTELDMT